MIVSAVRHSSDMALMTSMNTMQRFMNDTSIVYK